MHDGSSNHRFGIVGADQISEDADERQLVGRCLCFEFVLANKKFSKGNSKTVFYRNFTKLDF